MNETFISTLNLIITLLAFYFAYFTWRKNSRDKQTQLIKILEIQLACLGPWMGTTGYGYGDELTEEQKFDNVQPFRYIYKTAVEPLVGITELESISNVPKEIISEIYQLYYDLLRMRYLQSSRDAYVSSDKPLAISVNSKLRQYQAQHKNNDFYKFINSLTKEEQFFAQQLIFLGTEIHCKVIGNKDKCARHHWENIYKWVKSQSELKNDWKFILTTLLTVMTLIFLSPLNVASDTVSMILALIVTIISTVGIAYKNGALIFPPI